ncbi:MAG: L,D-transpeptidase [Clostridia bacterium]|nr:L,D-transpeptidase [Clostridia bacterium]
MQILRKPISIILIFLCLAAGAAQASSLAFKSVPDIIRPGKYYEFRVDSPQIGSASVSLLDPFGMLLYVVFDEYPIVAGENSLQWDGRRREDFSAFPAGNYRLEIRLSDGMTIDSPLRIDMPFPMLTHIQQSASVISSQLDLSYVASEAGTLTAELVSPGITPVTLASVEVDAGPNTYHWDAQIGDERVPDGNYAVVLTLHNKDGESSMAERVYIEILTDEQEDNAPGRQNHTEQIYSLTPDAPPALSPPYSLTNAGTYWTMTPGELDDAIIWDIMMRPIYVYNEGKAKGTDHAYLMENPDGSGERIAQIHVMSQGFNVLTEPNEHGYVLVEAFPNYDRQFYPKSEEEIATVFDLKRGYLKASGIQKIEVMSDMALLIDKLSQRMYLFIDGVRVTEFLISTGTFTGSDYLFETPPGEFITISHTGQLVDGNMRSDMALRINGGVLVHEVPHKENKDGSANYSSFEGYLGTKQSHGCIRVQRKKNAEGYNHKWIWDNFQRGKPYKVIIWDDRGRVDQPTTWQANP